MNRWVAGARPRTLPASVIPVAVGTATVVGEGDIIWWRVGAAAIVALALQVGTNYANDYSDGVRGADEGRVGPRRLVASGLATPKAVRNAAFIAFGVAAVAGLALAIAVGPELIAVGAASIAAGWFYTGGPKPYGYLGLGELFVFVFFGLVAVVGSSYVQIDSVTLVATIAAVPVGLLIVALLVANNLRDIPSDTAAGKRTLAVRMGAEPTRLFYVALLAAAFIATIWLGALRTGALLGLLAIAVSVRPVRTVLAKAEGASLIPVIGDTGRVQLLYGALVTIGLAL